MNKKIFLIFSLLCPLSLFSSPWSTASVFAFFSAVGNSFSIDNLQMMKESLYRKQKTIVSECQNSNHNEPDFTVRKLNLVKAQYKQCADLEISCSGDPLYTHRHNSLFAKKVREENGLGFLPVAVLLNNPSNYNGKSKTLKSNVSADENWTTKISQRLKIGQLQYQWSKVCNKAETISLQNVADFNRNDDYAIKNRQSLAKSNVLIQREHELIDQMNADVLSGKGIDYSVLHQLNTYREIGKTIEEWREAKEIKDYIEQEQTLVKNKMQWAAVREELKKEKLPTARALSQRGIPSELRHLILAEFLPSPKEEYTTFRKEYYQKYHTDSIYSKKTPLESLRNMRDKDRK